jgi:hypothetical protein
MFCNWVFLRETRDFVIVEDTIHSVDSVSEKHYKYSITVGLGSTDLN